MTTMACLHANCCFVDEFHWLILRKTPREAGFVSKELWERHQPRFLSAWLDADKLPVLWPFLLELHVTIALGIQCVIPADTNVDACMKARAARTHKNISRNNGLAAKNLDAQAF